MDNTINNINTVDNEIISQAPKNEADQRKRRRKNEVKNLI